MGEIIKLVIKNKGEVYVDKKFKRFLYKFGKEKKDAIVLNPYEALYIFEKRNCIFLYKDLILSFEEVLEILDIDLKKYLVFKDLVERGYRLIIEKDNWILLDKYSKEPLWYLLIYDEFEEIDLSELIELIKSCKEKGLKLLVAIVDIEGDVIYYDFHLLNL